MATPLCSQSWPVPTREGTNLNAISTRLARRLGGAWSPGGDTQVFSLWRVQDGVRLDLHLEPAGPGGALVLRLEGSPERWMTRGCLPMALVGVACPPGVGGVWSRHALIVSLVLAAVAVAVALYERVPRGPAVVETRRQHHEAARIIQEALGGSP